jgi:hypothetical protein
MSALAQQRRADAPARPPAVTFPRVLRSEWIKLRSLRSTTLTLAAGLAAMVGMAVLVALVRNGQWDGMTAAQRQGVSVSYDVHVGGRFLGQLLIGVVGVLIVTGEYATGMIRATLTAVPRRLPVLAAKLTLLAALLFSTTLVASFAAWFAGSGIMAAHWPASLSDPGVLRAVIGQAVVLTETALLGAALGFLLRNTAAAIATLFGIVLVLPVVGQLWSAVAPYLPPNALESFALATVEPPALSPWAGLALFSGFTAVVLAGGVWTLLRKDA